MTNLEFIKLYLEKIINTDSTMIKKGYVDTLKKLLKYLTEKELTILINEYPKYKKYLAD